MTTQIKTVDVCGDVLTIEWTGSVWVSPHNGEQHSNASNAMLSELEAYFLACGEDIDSDEVSQQMDEYLSQMAR